jgi:hypothetical protein
MKDEHKSVDIMCSGYNELKNKGKIEFFNCKKFAGEGMSNIFS